MIPTWNLLNESERFDTLRAMETYGGSFVAALARAWQRADHNNARRLGEMFADFVAAYGPGTGFYESVQRFQLPLTGDAEIKAALKGQKP